MHLDIFWSREAGMHTDCKNFDLLKSKIESIDENGNPVFKDNFQEKIAELNNKYNYYPEDINKDTCDWKDFQIVLVYCMNWGMIDGDYEDFDRESMKWEEIKDKYNEGKSAYEILRSYIVVSKE